MDAMPANRGENAGALPHIAHTAVGRRAVLLGSLAGIAAAPAPNAAIPIDTSNGLCRVSVSLDGKLAAFILDTGAETSLLTRDAVARLGLRPDGWVATTVRGAGGRLERHSNIDVASARLGAVPLFQRQPADGLSLPVTSAAIDADGLLGGDILHHFTLDLDVPSKQLFLGAPFVIPPSTPTVKLLLLRRSLLLAPVRLDGHALLALVDTGASASLINARGLYRLGITPSALTQDRQTALHAIGGVSLARLHRFSELRIGTLAVPSPVMLEDDVPEAAFDLLLGLDILGRQNMFLSYPGLTLSLGPAASL